MRGPHPSRFQRWRGTGKRERGSPCCLHRARCRPAAVRKTSRPFSSPSSVGADATPVWLPPALGAQLHLGAGWDIPPERWEGGCEPEGGGTRLTGSDLLRKKALLSCFFSELGIKHLLKPAGKSAFFFFFPPPFHATHPQLTKHRGSSSP